MMLVVIAVITDMKPERKPPCTAVVCFVIPLAYWSWFLLVCVCYTQIQHCFSKNSSALGVLVQ